MKIRYFFQSFSKQDWHWFDKFARSPIFNRHEGALKLFHYYRKNYTRNSSDADAATLHKVLFPELPFEPARVHHVNNYLHKLAEDYLAWSEWEQDTTEKDLYLLQATRTRQLTTLFQQVWKRIRELRDKQPLRNSGHYRFEYRVALETYQHSMQQGRTTEGHLQPLSHWHDVAFIAEKLKNACIFESRKRILQGATLDTGLLHLVLNYLQTRRELLEIPAISVYYFGYLSLVEPEEDSNYFSLKALLNHHSSFFPTSELRDLYLLATNFCIHRINQRQDQYLREIFEWYKSGIEREIFVENGQISRFTYTNIALASLRLKEFEWAWLFLHRYRDYLPENQRTGAFAFNLARYHCERGDYSEAMPLLLEMDFDDVLHNLIAKAMLLRMYYETRAFDALESLLNSTSVYLRRKRQITPQQRDAYTNLVRVLRKLIAISPRDKAARKALSEEIAQLHPLAEKDWLRNTV